MTDIRCGVPDYTVPANPPMTCGSPATCTTTDPHGATVGVCARHEEPVAAAGYTLTRLEDRP